MSLHTEFKADSVNAEAEQALTYLIDNIDFFVASFQNPNKFTKWVNNQNNEIKSCIAKLTENILNAFPVTANYIKTIKNEFYTAMADRILYVDNDDRCIKYRQKMGIAVTFVAGDDKSEDYRDAMDSELSRPISDIFIEKFIEKLTEVQKNEMENSLETKTQSDKMDRLILEYLKIYFKTRKIPAKYVLEIKNMLFDIISLSKQKEQNERIKPFQEAIFGKGGNDRKNSLYKGNQQRIKELLQSNPKLVDAILAFSGAASISHVIDCFNREYKNPTFFNLNALRQQEKAEKEEKKQEINRLAQEEERKRTEEEISRIQQDNIKKEEAKLQAERKNDIKKLTDQTHLLNQIIQKTSLHLNYLQNKIKEEIKSFWISPVVRDAFLAYYFGNKDVKNLDKLSISGAIALFAKDITDGKNNFQAEKKVSDLVRKNISSNLRSLLFKYHHAKTIQAMLSDKSNEDPNGKIMRVKTYIEPIKKQFNEERGFFCWLLGKLGLIKSESRQLMHFFQKKCNEGQERGIISLNNRLESKRITRS